MFGGTATGMINDENFNYQSQTDEFELEHRAFAEANIEPEESKRGRFCEKSII